MLSGILPLEMSCSHSSQLPLIVTDTTSVTWQCSVLCPTDKNNTSSGSMKSESFFSRMHTSGLIVEHRHSYVALSVDLASHMSHQCPKGTIAIATSHPQALMSSVRKQWLRLIRILQRERASTLNHQRIDDLNKAIHFMQTTSFTAKDPSYDPVHLRVICNCRAVRCGTTHVRHIVYCRASHKNGAIYACKLDAAWRLSCNLWRMRRTLIVKRT
jgi:hypothetical protein